MNASDSAIGAFNWAAENLNTENVRIINLSLGWPDGTYDNLQTAIELFTNAGGLLICAAGNDGINLDINNSFPASLGYYDPNNPYTTNDSIMVVGVLNYNDSRPSWSNWGANTVDIYAPGVNILSTYPNELCAINDDKYIELFDIYLKSCEAKWVENNGIGQWQSNNTYHKIDGYHGTSGTSTAAPHVTGVAALLLSVNPSLTAAKLKECILEGAETITITTGDGEEQEVKKLDAFGAFLYLMENYPNNSAEIVFEDAIYNDTVNASSEYFYNNAYMQKFDVLDAGTYTFTISADYPINVRLYDHELNEITVTQTKSNDNREIEIEYNLSQSTYYLRSEFTDSTSVGEIIVSVDAPTHTHEYAGWIYNDSSTHRNTCNTCHHEIIGAHVTRISEIVNGRAPCIHCGWFINVGDFSGVIHNLSKVSINGSYILPNGVIVLVDEDVEAYLNGTLVFYDKDKLPEVQ